MLRNHRKPKKNYKNLKTNKRPQQINHLKEFVAQQRASHSLDIIKKRGWLIITTERELIFNSQIYVVVIWPLLLFQELKPFKVFDTKF